jgi:putative Mg2+ transporter-C (MgtC) family protein
MDGTLALPLSQMLLRLGAANLFGVIVGFERERLERAAGLRTHALVALASALIMLVSAYSFADLPATPRDPTRMAAQVVSGIGFLGAGVIIFRKNAVRGLTTAASVWAAAGGGLLVVATVATVCILLIQVGLRPLERRFFTHHRAHRLELRLQRATGNLAMLEQAILAAGVNVRGLRVRPARGGREDRVEIAFGAIRDATATALLDTLRNLTGVRLVTYTLGGARPLHVVAGAASEAVPAEDDDELDEEE